MNALRVLCVMILSVVFLNLNLLTEAIAATEDYAIYFDGDFFEAGFFASNEWSDDEFAAGLSAIDENNWIYVSGSNGVVNSRDDLEIWVVEIPSVVESEYGAEEIVYSEEPYFDVRNGSGESVGYIYVEEINGVKKALYYDSVGNLIASTNVSTYTYDEFMALYGIAAIKEEAQASAVIETARIASRQTTQMVSTRILSLFSPRPSLKKVAAASSNPFQSGYSEAPLGMASGDGAPMFGAWGMGSYSIYENDKAGYRTDGNVGVLLAGLDRLFLEDRLAVGVAAGYENNYYKLKDYDEKYRGTGYAITPYAAYRVTDQFLVKALAGVTFLDYDVSGNSDYSATRTMTDLSAEYSWYIDAWQLTAEGGWMYIDEGANHDYKDVYLAEGRLSAKVGYEVAPNMLPYAKLTYHNDLAANKASELDDDDLQGALGINVFHDAWIFSIEGIYTFEREDEELYGGSVLVRYEF